MVTNNWWKTIDGEDIVEGLRVWDYNLDVAIVVIKGTDAEETHEYHKYWDGWFDMKDPDGNRSSTMNGERMWVRPPTTGEKA